MTISSSVVRFSLGNASNLANLGDAEADLVFTSPPYFSPKTETLLRQPLRSQDKLPQVERDVVAFALSLRPVFEEIRRVLKPTGLLVLQTKDVRYAGWLICVTSVHREIVESLGLRMLTRLWWQPMFDSRKHVPPPPRPGGRALFRVRQVEEFQVYGYPGMAKARGPAGIDAEELQGAQSPLWRLAGPGGHRRHPHQSPGAVVRRLIALYTVPGDLVVDPFAGSGAILETALALGRRVAGCEIDSAYAAGAERRLLAVARRQRRAR